MTQNAESRMVRIWLDFPKILRSCANLNCEGLLRTKAVRQPSTTKFQWEVRSADQFSSWVIGALANSAQWADESATQAGNFGFDHLILRLNNKYKVIRFEFFIKIWQFELKVMFFLKDSIIFIKITWKINISFIEKYWEQTSIRTVSTLLSQQASAKLSRSCRSTVWIYFWCLNNWIEFLKKVWLL